MGSGKLNALACGLLSAALLALIDAAGVFHHLEVSGLVIVDMGPAASGLGDQGICLVKFQAVAAVARRCRRRCDGIGSSQQLASAPYTFKLNALASWSCHTLQLALRYCLDSLLHHIQIACAFTASVQATIHGFEEGGLVAPALKVLQGDGGLDAFGPGPNLAACATEFNA